MMSWTFRAERLPSPASRFSATMARTVATIVRRIEDRWHPPERISWNPEMDHSSHDDDASLFRRHMGEARPLKHDRERVAPIRRPLRRASPAPAPEDGGRTEEHPGSGPGRPGPGEAVERGSRMEFARPGLQHREIRRLRRGHHPIQDRLDLHGLSAHEAERAVLEFIDRSRSQGMRCVCIIHGKGRGSAKRRPVLKAIVDRWLRRCEGVLAFCTAPDNAGGTGAVHVLLRA